MAPDHESDDGQGLGRAVWWIDRSNGETVEAVADRMYMEPTGSLELGDYLAVLRRRWRLLVLVTLLGVGVAAVWSFRQTPVYQATASVLVNPLRTSSSPQQAARLDQLINMTNEKQLALSATVAVRAGEILRSSATPDELLKHVSAEVPADSQVLKISYRDTNPVTAQRGAGAFAQAYLDNRGRAAADQVDKVRKSLTEQQNDLTEKKRQAEEIISNPDALEAQRRTAEASVRVYDDQLNNVSQELLGLEQLDLSPGRLIQPPAVPTSPASPRHLLNVGLGAFVGLVLAMAVAFVRDRSDDRLRGREDLAERLDRPVLATIPKLSRWKRRPGRLGWRRRNPLAPVFLDEPASAAAEAYRTLRTRVARLAAQLDINSIMVVSPDVGEGKSTTAANLAIALAESGSDVLLVSADLRRPRVHQFFGLPNKSGLANILVDGAPDGPPADGLQSHTAVELWSVGVHLWAILSGPHVGNASSLMDSYAMKEFLKEQRDLFDFVILDCAPALVVADSLALAPLVDAVLVVADAKETRRTAVSQLREQLEHVGGKTIGAVLNRAPKSHLTSSSYYSYEDV
jgi:polysaccharide biosynthesis transport protein